MLDRISVQYDIEVDSVDSSIMNIPAVAALVPVAWATGADIYVEAIDADYLDSLARVKAVFGRWFPQFSFSTVIDAPRIVRNKCEHSRKALLFSGGIGSMTSFLRNKGSCPALINVWGADHPSEEQNEEKRFIQWKDKYLSCDFAGSEIHFVRTNIGSVINNKLLTDDFVKEHIKDADWWQTTSHGLIYTGLSAPITMAKGAATLLVASSFTRDCSLPHGSHLFNFADVRWAGTKVTYDSSDLSRQQKIRTQLSGNQEYYRYIHVCPLSFDRVHNCSICEKCWRTIVGLIMEGIDPNRCNFKVRRGILDCAKEILMNGWMHLDYDETILWKDLQVHIPDHIADNSYGARPFLEWLKGFDFPNYQYHRDRGTELIRHFLCIARYDAVFACKMAVKHAWSLFGSLTRTNDTA